MQFLAADMVTEGGGASMVDEIKTDGNTAGVDNGKQFEMFANLPPSAGRYDLDLLDDNDAVVASNSYNYKDVAGQAVTLVIKNDVAVFSIDTNIAGELEVQGDAATFSKGKVRLRLYGKIDGMTIQAKVRDTLFGHFVYGGRVAGNGMVEILIPFDYAL